MLSGLASDTLPGTVRVMHRVASLGLMLVLGFFILFMNERICCLCLFVILPVDDVFIHLVSEIARVVRASL